MQTKPVRWYEGMLVLPHHFQAADEYWHEAVTTNADWLNPYSYGIRSLRLHAGSLANYEVRIVELQCRLKDGTLVSVPDNGQLAVLDVRPSFEHAQAVYVHLLLPRISAGRPNSAHDRESLQSHQRYVCDTVSRDEVNSGGNARDVDTNEFNFTLRAMENHEIPAGYESIPILRLRRSDQPGAVPELDPNYIPPLLACQSFPVLHQDILISISSQVGSFIKRLAEKLGTQGGWNEIGSPQVMQSVLQISAANASYPVLQQLFHSRLLHPFQAYVEICRLIGQLSFSRPNWEPPSLPMYDHDRLADVFSALRAELDSIISSQTGTGRLLRFPFVGTGEWLEVGLESDWLADDPELYIAITSQLPPETLDRLFAESHLDWKLGSSRNIADIYRNAEHGLRVQRYSGQSGLPPLTDVTYFKIETSGHYWQQLLASPTLALKVNDRFIQSNYTGKNTLDVADQQGTQHHLTFDLFVQQHE